MPQPHTTLRAATLADARAIAEIYAESVAIGDATFDRVAWTTAEVEERLRTEGDAFPTLVIEQEQRVLGWAGVRQHNPRRGYRLCCELAIYLRRNATGQGHGGPLMEAILQAAQQHGFHHIVSRISGDNARSIRFHERHGFERVGVQKEIGCVDGRWVDVAILQKIFEGEPPAGD